MSDKAKSLSLREQQIMDCFCARGAATASEIQAQLPDAPGNSVVRALLSVMKSKGVLRHREVEGRYVYRPVESRLVASRAVLRKLFSVLFEGLLVFPGVVGFILLLAGGICRADTARPSAESGVGFKTLFVELTPSQARDAGLPGEGRAAMPEKRASVLLDLFSLNGKAKVMKLPKACAKVSQGAMMELHVGKGVAFPTELDKNGLHPASYGLEFPGFNVEVKPVRWTDHRCDVEVQARALRFHGFEIPSMPGRVVTDRPTVAPKGELARPVFHFRSWKGKVDMAPGTWILQRLETLATSHPLALSLEGEPREMWMFLCIEKADKASASDAATQKQGGKP